ncbi:MAG TPA: glycosyltransferase, partial [Verrucomicrobiae bacterium]
MNTASIMGSVSRKGGGLFESEVQLERALAEAGMRVTVMGLRDEWTERDLPAWGRVRVRVFEVVGPRRLGYSPGLRRELLGSGFDLVHAQGLWMYTSVAVLAWHERSGGPYVVSPHGMLDGWAVRNSGWKKRLAGWCYERRHLEGAACIRALCESEAQAIRGYGLRNPICVIPNGVELAEEGEGEGNPKSEGRSPKEVRNPKSETPPFPNSKVIPPDPPTRNGGAKVEIRNSSESRMGDSWEDDCQVSVGGGRWSVDGRRWSVVSGLKGSGRK